MSGGRNRLRPPKSSPREDRRVGWAKRWPLLQHVTVQGFDVFQNPHAAEPGEAQLPTQAPVDAVADSFSFVEKISRSTYRLPQGVAPFARHLGSIQIGLSRERTPLLFGRKVHASAAPINCQIL